MAGPAFTERVSFDLTDDAVRAQTTFSVVDHVAVATCTHGDGAADRGWGLFEHKVIDCIIRPASPTGPVAQP